MPNLNVNFGKSGAKRASWKEVNPRATLARIVQLNPDDEPKWRREFWAFVKKREDYLRAITEYYLDHTIAALKGQNGRRKQTGFLEELEDSDSGAAELEQVEQRTAEATRQAFNYLGLKMPDGRQIGDWTGREGRNFGGWIASCSRAYRQKQSSKICAATKTSMRSKHRLTFGNYWASDRARLHPSRLRRASHRGSPFILFARMQE
jgi:hypothetical protein